MPDQSTGTLSFNRPRLNQSAATNVVVDNRLSVPGDNQVKVEEYVSLDPTAVAEVRTITISAGVTGNLYVVVVDGDAPPVAGVATPTLGARTYIYQQKDGDTPAIIAAALTRQLNEDPRVNVRADAATITLTGTVAGLPFTLDVAGSTTPANLVLARPTQAAGTVRHVKVADISIIYGVTTAGLPTVVIALQWFSGEPTSVEFQTPVRYAATGPRSFDEMMTLNGVQRPT